MATRPDPAAAFSPWLLGGFRAYSRRYLARHFHGMRLAADSPIPRDVPGRPVIVYLNHAAWWDPLFALLLAERFFPHRRAFAPMDQRELERHGFFRRLGFFGIDQGTRAGARAFKLAAESILADPGAMLWLTPQGRFADARERPLRFGGGLAALARRFPHAEFVPLALEYPFWDARLPEALARFGEPPADLRACAGSRALLGALLESHLAAAMDRLAIDAQSREPGRFVPLLQGRGGVNLPCDLWGWLRAKPASRQSPAV